MTAKRRAAVPLDEERRANILRRIKTARGHLEGVREMVDDDATCIDLLTQLSAIRSSIDRVSHLVLEHHLDRCFMELVRSGDEKTAVSELMRALAYAPRK